MKNTYDIYTNTVFGVLSVQDGVLLRLILLFFYAKFFSSLEVLKKRYVILAHERSLRNA